MSDGFEYRALCRIQRSDGSWTDWAPQGNREAYATLGAARAFLTQARNQYIHNRRHYGNNQAAMKFKIQRRPTGGWEDFE